MYITHKHPIVFTEDQQRLDTLQALHRTCLTAIQQHRNDPKMAPGSLRSR